MDSHARDFADMLRILFSFEMNKDYTVLIEKKAEKSLPDDLAESKMSSNQANQAVKQNHIKGLLS